MIYAITANNSHLRQRTAEAFTDKRFITANRIDDFLDDGSVLLLRTGLPAHPLSNALSSWLDDKEALNHYSVMQIARDWHTTSETVAKWLEKSFAAEPAQPAFFTITDGGLKFGQLIGTSDAAGQYARIKRATNFLHAARQAASQNGVLPKRIGDILIEGDEGTGETTLGIAIAYDIRQSGFVTEDAPLCIAEARQLLDLGPPELDAAMQNSFGPSRQGVLVTDRLDQLFNYAEYGQQAVAFTLKRLLDTMRLAPKRPIIVATFANVLELSLPDADRYFQNRISLKPFTPRQLRDIFEQRCKREGLSAEDAALDAVESLLESTGHTNVHWVDKIFNKAVENATGRLSGAEPEYTIKKEHIPTDLQDLDPAGKRPMVPIGYPLASPNAQGPKR